MTAIPHIVILAAGLGSRLGRALPKPLTSLADGRTIMGQQLDNLAAVFGPAAPVHAVVGYRADDVIEAHPNIRPVFNELYDQTNTSKSLLRALDTIRPGGVLWLNGDLVFDPLVLGRCIPLIRADHSFTVVNTARTADEEVKYTLDDDGFIAGLSKTVTGALGEAVGINYIATEDRRALVRELREVADHDYFERGIELAIAHERIRVAGVDISDLYAVEIDNESDLTGANAAMRR